MADNLTREQRSYTMSQIRSKDTTPEMTIRRLVHARGLRFRKHVGSLPGKPDLVFIREQIVVFVDGDFWHGWRFPQWRDNIGAYWQQKIEGNRNRDRRNFNKLRRLGWQVIRIWEHDVKRDADECVDRIEAAVHLQRTEAVTR